jgi:hypothetical protein
VQSTAQKAPKDSLQSPFALLMFAKLRDRFKSWALLVGASANLAHLCNKQSPLFPRLCRPAVALSRDGASEKVLERTGQPVPGKSFLGFVLVGSSHNSRGEHGVRCSKSWFCKFLLVVAGIARLLNLKILSWFNLKRREDDMPDRALSAKMK